jgi:ketosteroid isomerase-like protein
MTKNTLVMDVQHIVANDHFGAVLGVIRAHPNGQVMEMPFCGLWRFRSGRIVEHWENAYDAVTLGRFCTDRPDRHLQQ